MNMNTRNKNFPAASRSKGFFWSKFPEFIMAGGMAADRQDSKNTKLGTHILGCKHETGSKVQTEQGCIIPKPVP